MREIYYSLKVRKRIYKWKSRKKCLFSFMQNNITYIFTCAHWYRWRLQGCNCENNFIFLTLLVEENVFPLHWMCVMILRIVCMTPAWQIGVEYMLKWRYKMSGNEKVTVPTVYVELNNNLFYYMWYFSYELVTK